MELVEGVANVDNTGDLSLKRLYSLVDNSGMVERLGGPTPTKKLAEGVYVQHGISPPLGSSFLEAPGYALSLRLHACQPTPDVPFKHLGQIGEPGLVKSLSGPLGVEPSSPDLFVVTLDDMSPPPRPSAIRRLGAASESARNIPAWRSRIAVLRLRSITATRPIQVTTIHG